MNFKYKPRINISVENMVIVTNTHNIIRAFVNIQNVGKRMFSPDSCEIRLRQIIPETTLVSYEIDRATSQSVQNIEFPLIEKKSFSKSMGFNLEIEPGEIETLWFDFPQRKAINKPNNFTYELYFYMPNHAKNSNMGWAAADIVEVR